MTASPNHIAIIMDGNGRWAKKRFLPRVAGHKVGKEAIRKTIAHCVKKGISALTVFAFSSENWTRPDHEVSFLMNLFLTSLDEEIKELHKQNISVRIIGDRSTFNEKFLTIIEKAETLTAANTLLKLNIAFNYGGQWDITHAMQQIAKRIEAGILTSQDINASLIQSMLALSDISPPDLFIRTSGEQRISNFLLWQLSYTELYFTDVLWPDFDEAELDKAIAFYSSRERRFGATTEQVHKVDSNA